MSCGWDVMGSRCGASLLVERTAGVPKAQAPQVVEFGWPGLDFRGPHCGSGGAVSRESGKMDVQTEVSTGQDVPRALYDRLEERVLARDQVGASQTYYDLLRAGRPLNEIVAAGVRIHAPYTHVPYHERFDDGYPNFVNNDHCLLSARATLNLARMLPGKLADLPMAQTIWYIPTGLDIWNQKINKAPGHYARGMAAQKGAPPTPVVHWPDQEPESPDGPLRDRLDHWLTLVHRGRVLEAYRVFL